MTVVRLIRSHNMKVSRTTFDKWEEGGRGCKDNAKMDETAKSNKREREKIR